MAVTMTKRPAAIRQEEQAKQAQTAQPTASVPASPLAQSLASGATNRPAVTRQQGGSLTYGPVQQSTPETIFKDAQAFYDSGNEAMGAEILYNYTTQMRDSNSPYYKPQYTTWDKDNGDEQKTLAAESDLLQMYTDVQTAVNKGYSDSWIKGNISAKNYPGLVALDNSTVLTRQLQYLGDDTVNGMIYAARNGGSKNASDILTSMYAYNLGWGNSYRPDYKSEAAKDPESEIYHPYMQGIHGEGKTAEEDTYAAKEELELLKQACRKRLEAGESVDSVYDAYFGNGLHGLDYGTSETEAAYPTLYAMEYARQNKTALALTEDVDFAAPYFKQWLYDQQEEINAINGEADSKAALEVFERQTESLVENVPNEYHNLVLELYARDKGLAYDDMSAKALEGLDAWLKEQGLIGAENFRTAYLEAEKRLGEKWSSEVMPSENFEPIDFISTGENIDPELNSKQVGFRLGMKEYLSGRAVTDSDAKAFIQKYGFLMNSYDPNEYQGVSGLASGNGVRGSRATIGAGKTRQNEVTPKLDSALDRLDAAFEKGEIEDTDYYNLYLQVASSYDQYLAMPQPTGPRAPRTSYSKYLATTAAADGKYLDQSLADMIDGQITASKAIYDEKAQAKRLEVAKSFGNFERAAARGETIVDPTAEKIRSIKINPQEQTDEEYLGYYRAYTIRTIPDMSQYGEHYDADYIQLASYDTAEIVNDIMRLAQYNGTSFTEARKAMGFETEQDLADWLYEYDNANQKKCSDIVETMFAVGNQLLASDKGTTAADLLKQGKIDEETFNRFRKGLGTSENEERFYSRLPEMGGVNAASLVYKDAMQARSPADNEAHGYSSRVEDIIKYGAWNGWITHKDSWVTAALGFLDMTPEERESKARYDYHNDPKAYKDALIEAVQEVCDPAIVNDYLQQIASYEGDIFKFDFNTDSAVIALKDAKNYVTNEKAALDAEMRELLSADAFKWYNTTGTAINSTLLSAEAILVAKTLGTMGASKSTAALVGQMLTTAPVEGGQVSYTLMQSGISGKYARLAGVIAGTATALSEYALEGLVQKGMYKTPLTRRISEFGKINTAAVATKVAAGLTERGAGKTTTKLLTLGAKGLIGTMNLARNATVSAVFNGLQEVQQDFTNDLTMAGVAELAGEDGSQFFGSPEDYKNTLTESFKSSFIQMGTPLSAGPAMMNTIRANSQQTQFTNEFGQVSSEINARGKAEVGTAQSLVEQAKAELRAAEADRQAAMDNLRAMNLEALVDQDTVQNLVNPAMELFNSEMTQKIDDLVAKGNSLNDQLATMESKVSEMSDMATEARAAVEQGDVSKEALDHLTETTDLMRSLDMAMEQTRADIKTNDEQLAKLKAEKQALRQQAYEKARQDAIESVLDEATKEEVAKRKHEAEQADALVEDAKAKHEAAKTRLSDALNAYQEELKTLQTEARAKQDLVNGIAEEDIISDGLVDAVLGISNVLDEVDIYEASAKENTFKQELLHMMELSFPGYKVEFRNLGRGQMGKVVLEDGKGVIVLNRDSTSFELMNGELGYEIAQIAQIDQDGYKPLYDAVTNAVYGDKSGTDAAFNRAASDAIMNGASTDLTQPNNYYDQAGSAVFANAIGRLLSGEFKDSGWVKKFSDKAPELAGDIFDWIANRSKEFKAMAKHGSKQVKAQYNEIIGVLGQLSESLGRANTIDYNGQTVAVDLSPVESNEATTDSAAEFVDSLIHSKNGEGMRRYIGPKHLPLFELQSDGSYVIDRSGLTTEENDLISTVEKAQMQAEYNAMNGEVTAESVLDELIEATQTTPLPEEQRAANTQAKAERLAQREERMARTEPSPVTVAEEQATPAEQEAPAAEQVTEEQRTEQTTEEETEQVNPARRALMDGLVDTLAQVSEFDETTRNKVLGKVRGIINSIKNGDRSRSAYDATNTPLAIVSELASNIGATMYQNAVQNKADTSTVVQSRPGFIATKRLLIRDVNEYINATGEHVLNTIQHEAENNGLTTDLTNGNREANIALFNAWMTEGITGLRNLANATTQAVEDFGGKLHLALLNSKQGRAMYNALTEAKGKLKAYYNADAVRQAAAYIRDQPESQKTTGEFSRWLHRKAEWLGQDVYGDVIDKLTGYASHVRKSLRYMPYAKNLGNMWIGDHETAKGFVDLDRHKVLGAKTLTEAMKAPFNSKWFAKNKEYVWNTVNQMLALQSALDRYTPVKTETTKNEKGEKVTKPVNRDPFSSFSDKAMSEAAKFLGIEGHLTKEKVQAAISELSKDTRIVEAAENVREWWRNIMKQAVKEGVVTQETYDTFQQENPHYAPLQRDMSVIAKGSKHIANSKGTTQGELAIGAKGIEFRRAKGHSDRAIINPLLSFSEMAQQMADKLEGNRVAQEFANAYDMAGYDTIGVFAGEVTEGQGNVLSEKGSDVLKVFYGDGTSRSFVVNNPELLELLQGHQLGKQDGWGSNVLSKTLAPVTRFMTRLTTSDNPIFAIRNAIRDFQTSVNYGSWATSYVDGLLSTKWFRAFGECLKYCYSKSWNELFHDDNSGKAGQQLEDFLFRGGEGFMRKSMTKNNKENIYGEIMGKNWGKRTLSATWDLITFGSLGDAVEMASRYVEYRFGENETKDSKGATNQSKFNAFMASREATVDFAQAGYGTFARNIRKIIPFFNATLQGWYRTGRMFTEAESDRRAARVMKTVTNNIISGALSAALNLFGVNVAGMLGGDEDDWAEQANEYLKLSQSLKTDFIILPLSALGYIGAKDFIRAPLLQDGLGKFSFNTGRLAVETVARAMRGEDVEISDVGLDLLKIAGNILKEPFTRDFIWTPFTDMAQNKTYFNTPLVNKTKIERGDPVSTWANATTPEFAFTVSDYLRSGAEAIFGKLPQWMNLILSPAGVEYTVKEFFGYPGQVALPMLSRDKYTGEAKGLKGLANSLLGNFTIDAETANDISSNWNDALEWITGISKLTEKTTGIGDLSAYLTSDERSEAVVEAKKALKKGGIIYETKQAVYDAFDKIAEINRDPTLTDKEKEQAVEEIYKQVNQIELEGTKWIREFEAKYNPDLDFISDFIYSVKAKSETLLDSGPGLASRRSTEPTAPATAETAATPVETEAEPEGLQMVKADIGGDLSGLSRTIPLGEEEETPRAPETSPDYTGERARGIETEYEVTGEQATEARPAQPASERRNGDNVYTRAGRKYTGDTTISLPEKSKLHPESVMPTTTGTMNPSGYQQTPKITRTPTSALGQSMEGGILNAGARANTQIATPVRTSSESKYSIATATAAPTQTGTTAKPTLTTKTEQATQKRTYNVPQGDKRVGLAYELTRSLYGDKYGARQVKEIYGDGLPDSYYTELAGYMEAAPSSELLPTPQTKITYNKKDYLLSSYTEDIQAEFLNDFMNAYQEQYMITSQLPEYINGTPEERLELFTKCRTKAREVAKKNFLAKYVK